MEARYFFLFEYMGGGRGEDDEFLLLKGIIHRELCVFYYLRSAEDIKPIYYCFRLVT
jgi:hypothetical protein